MESPKEEKLRVIWFVTCGAGENLPNPSITEQEKQQLAEKVKPHLPSQPPEIIIGTGRRHLQTAAALNLIKISLAPQIQVIGLLPALYTYETLVGGPEILTSSEEGKKIILADGTGINGIVEEIKEYIRHALLALVGHLPPNSIIVSDKAKLCLITKAQSGLVNLYGFLGKPENCALYKIEVNEAGSIIAIARIADFP